jgi:hypothetical protein
MGKIHTYPGSRKVFIEDVSVAVFVTKIGLIKGFFDAAKVLGSTPADVDAACRAGAKGAVVKGRRVRLATLAEAKASFPDYRPIAHGRPAPSPAVPTTVYVKVGGKRHPIHHRSMTAARVSWELSQTQFETIVAKRPGWRQMLPGCVDEIKTHSPGYKPPSKTFHTGPIWNQLFELTARKNGSVGIKYVGPASYPDVESIPLAVLNNS